MKKISKLLSFFMCIILLVQMTGVHSDLLVKGMSDSEVNVSSEQRKELDQQPTITQEEEQVVTSSAIRVQMYNVDRSERSNTIFANFKLINDGKEAINLSEIKIRYYYMLGGEISQNFWCDWSSAGTGNVTGTIVRSDPLYQGADTYVEIEFDEGSGELRAGAEVELKTRFARTDWNNYLQSDDYSFHCNATEYEDWNKVVVFVGDEVVWGEKPSVLMQQITLAGVKMFNKDRSEKTTTIHPWFKLYNTGTLPFDLEDVRIRYYYTVDGDKKQNFWCDWSSAGSENVTGTFAQVPYVTNGVDYFCELGFKKGSGSLIAGDYKEIQTRIAKEDWSEYTQTDDFSFNADSTEYQEWTKIGVYIKDKLVFGEGLLFGVPQNIVSSATENQISLTWDFVEGARGFQVEVDGEIVDIGLTTSYVQENLNPGTSHTYRVRATNPIMNGDWSDPLVVWTLPDIPQNITTLGMQNSIRLTWSPVEGATGYDVEVQGAPVDNGDYTTFIQTGLEANLQQTYRVRAKNSSGTGKWSNLVAESTLAAIPSNLGYTATDTEIHFTWDAAAGADSYEVEVDEEKVITTNETFYLHTALSPYTDHKYRVRSMNAKGVSDWSEFKYATTLLSIPTNLEVKVTFDGIKVTWDAVQFATEYEIEVNGSVISCNGELTSYLQDSYELNEEYSYRVRAKNGAVVSEWSDEITRKTYTGVPSNLSASATSTEISLSWEPVVGAISYELEVDGILINTEKNTFYKHSELQPCSDHKYRVRARNSAGASQWSAYVLQSTSLDTPTNLRATSTKATSITITWDGVTGADGYDVMVDGTVVDNEQETSYTHVELEPGSTHIYKVRAKSKHGGISGESDQTLSAWSKAITVHSNLGIPGNIQTIEESHRITIVWDEVEGATEYDIEVDGKVMNTKNETTYVHDGLAVETKHSYRVRAKNKSTVGAWSSVVYAQTLLGVPTGLKITPETSKMTLSWDPVEGAIGYDVEADEEEVLNMEENQYVQKGLQPNTMHSYRVRARGKSGVGEWSEYLIDRTIPELVINLPTDTMFNFVVVAPAKEDANEIKVVVSYNPKELEVLDLCGATQKEDLHIGKVEGKSIMMDEFQDGKITFRFLETDETQVNVIKFISKTNAYANVTYRIE